MHKKYFYYLNNFEKKNYCERLNIRFFMKSYALDIRLIEGTKTKN